MTKVMTDKKVKVAIGLDAGNSSFKLISNGQAVSYENVFAPRRKVEEALERDYDLGGSKFDELRDMLDVSITKEGEIIGEEFLLGSQASKYKKFVQERKTYLDKAQDEHLVRRGIVTMVTTVLEAMEKDELQDEMEMQLNVCTGLPYNEYKNKENIEKYISYFKGNHIIEFLNPNFPVKKVKVSIPNVVVDIEGMAALKQIIADKQLTQGNISEIANKVVSIIDIGCFTTDIVAGTFRVVDSENGKRVVFDANALLCIGIKDGIGNAMDSVLKRLMKKYPAIKDGDYTRNDIVQAIQNTYNENCIPGTDFNIEPEFSRECMKLAKSLADAYIDLYSNTGYQNAIYKIYISGGGVLTESVVKCFDEMIKKTLGENLVEVITDEPIYANAKGYSNIAKYAFRNK